VAVGHTDLFVSPQHAILSCTLPDIHNLAESKVSVSFGIIGEPLSADMASCRANGVMPSVHGNKKSFSSSNAPHNRETRSRPNQRTSQAIEKDKQDRKDGLGRLSPTTPFIEDQYMELGSIVSNSALNIPLSSLLQTL
jgi:hypothetical protein